MEGRRRPGSRRSPPRRSSPRPRAPRRRWRTRCSCPLRPAERREVRLRPVAEPPSSVHESAARGFARAPEDYERGRPTYPPEALALLARILRLEPGRTVLDLAAGTGKLTRALAPTGARLVAVEPVAAMRAKLAESLPEARVLAGTAERIPLVDGSVDAVALEQAQFGLEHELAPDGVVARVASVSFVAALPDAARDEVLGRVRELFAEDRETRGRTTVVLPYRTDVYWCERV